LLSSAKKVVHGKRDDGGAVLVDTDIFQIEDPPVLPFVEVRRHGRRRMAGFEWPRPFT